MSLESSQRELQDCFRPHPNRRSEQEVMDAQSPGSPDRDNFRDSSLGVSGKSAIRMWPRQRAAENTIRGKVVVSPEFRPW
jgi:hypothetical protein